METSLKKQVWVAVLGLLLGAVSHAESPDIASEPIRLVTAAGSVDTVIAEVILREAYGRLGYRVEVTRYPAERAIRMANQGRFDGEVQRIDGVADSYPNLVQLYPSINHVEGGVFTARDDLVIESWEDMRPYSCGIIRGIKFAERSTEGMDRYIVGGYNRLFTMLTHERFDLAVSPFVSAAYNLKRGGFDNIRPAGPVLERFELYHYLHRSRTDLKPEIEAELARMSENGELTAIREVVIREIMRRAEEGLALCDAELECFSLPVTDG